MLPEANEVERHEVPAPLGGTVAGAAEGREHQPRGTREGREHQLRAMGDGGTGVERQLHETGGRHETTGATVTGTRAPGVTAVFLGHLDLLSRRSLAALGEGKGTDATGPGRQT